MATREPDSDEVVKAIAAETNTPAETVSKLYADTVAHYRANGRIFDYISLLAAKKVRETLRHPPH
jgi:hypothetical protein